MIKAEAAGFRFLRFGEGELKGGAPLGSPVQGELAFAKQMTEGLFFRKQSFDVLQPLRLTYVRHLPLHRGGEGWLPKRAPERDSGAL